MSAERDDVVNAILSAIEECGPMARAEICRHIGRSKTQVASTISRMSKESPRRQKRLYILHYVHDDEDARNYPRAVYAIGDRPDAKKPKPDQLAVKRRYWARRRAKLLANSVFNLGLKLRTKDGTAHP